MLTASYSSTAGKCQEAHVTKLALACQILLLTIYRYEAKIKDFKTGENKSESYTARTCGVRTGYLAGLSSSWRETQTPRKWPRALSPSLGPTPPSMYRPPEQSFATPPPAGPEWGRCAWPRCSGTLKGEERLLHNTELILQMHQPHLHLFTAQSVKKVKVQDLHCHLPLGCCF